MVSSKNHYSWHWQYHFREATARSSCRCIEGCVTGSLPEHSPRGLNCHRRGRLQSNWESRGRSQCLHTSSSWPRDIQAGVAAREPTSPLASPLLACFTTTAVPSCDSPSLEKPPRKQVRGCMLFKPERNLCPTTSPTAGAILKHSLLRCGGARFCAARGERQCPGLTMDQALEARRCGKQFAYICAGQGRLSANRRK